MSRCDLYTASTKRLIRQQRVGNDRDQPPVDRNADLLSDEVRVPLIGWVDADGGIAEHRLGASRAEANHRMFSDRRNAQGLQTLGFVRLSTFVFHHRVIKRPEVPINLLVIHLIIRHSSLQEAVPVDQPLASEDVPVLEHLEESPPHRFGADIVQREPYTPPVAGEAQ